MGEFDEALEYITYATLDEALQLVVEYAESARHAENRLALGMRLKIASRAMRCALEIYGDWSTQEVRKEEKT